MTVAHGLQNCGESDIAREMYEFAFDIPEYKDLPWGIRTQGLAFYGGFLWTQRENEKARALLYESLQDPPEQMSLQERTDFAHRHSSYGLILDTMNKHHEATAYHITARESLTVLHGPMHVAVNRAILNEATNALYLGKIDQGESLAQQAKIFFQNSPKVWTAELIESDVLLSASALMKGNARHAIDQLETVFEFMDEHSLPTYRWNMYATTLLAAALIATNDQSDRLDSIYTECIKIKTKLGSSHPWLKLLEPYFVQADNKWIALTLDD